MTDHPAKTVNSIITAICTALEQADKLANHEDVSENTALLRQALINVPPADLNEMSSHINAMYQACENMEIKRIAFRCDTERKRVVVIVGIQFGVREIELFAPFDGDGAKSLLKELVGSLNLLEPSRILFPDEGSA